MISNHLPEHSTCIRASAPTFAEISQTDALQMHFLLAAHHVPLIPLVAGEAGMSCVVRKKLVFLSVQGFQY